MTMMNEFDSDQVARDMGAAIAEYVRPSVLMKPRIFIDGNQWCALYGENLQDGVAGFGDSPELAFRDFDKNWETPLKSASF